MWYTGGGGRSAVSVVGKSGVVNLACFLSGKSEVDIGVVVGMAGGGVGTVGLGRVLKVDVAGRTLFLAIRMILLLGNISMGSEGIVVAGDDMSVGTWVVSSGTVGWTWEVGAVSSSSKGSVSSPDAKSGNSGTRGMMGETTVEDKEPSTSESDIE
jgi:hypothetical protein